MKQNTLFNIEQEIEIGKQFDFDGIPFKVVSGAVFTNGGTVWVDPSDKFAGKFWSTSETLFLCKRQDNYRGEYPVWCLKKHEILTGIPC